MWTRVLNVCSLNILEVNYLKTVKDTQNLRQIYRKPLRRGFQIISYMFNLKVKQTLDNEICCIHCMEYMYIITQNDRKCQNALKCLLRNGTKSNDTSSYIIFITPMHSVCREEFLSQAQTYQNLSKVGMGWIFNYSSVWCPLAFWLDQTGTYTTWIWGL